MKRLVLLVVLLLFGTVVQAQDETPDTDSITVGQTVNGEFEVGERDRYTLEVGETPTINIFLDGADDIDTYLRVYRQGEDEPFAENDDRGDGTLNSALYEVEAAGEVLIVEVGTYNDESEGSYTLRIAPPPTVEDMGEIALGDTVEGTFPENSRQRYILTVDETTTLRIALEGADDLDTYLRLYREGDAVPAVQNDSIDAESVAAGFEGIVVPAGTTLIIETGTFGDAGAGDYTLTVEAVDSATLTADEPIVMDDTVIPADVCADAASAAEPTRLQYFAPEDVIEEGVDYAAIFCTEAGAFVTDLYETEAPIAVNSFVYLATNHYFDQTTFHRVIEDFVVQGGDPTGTGFGGPGYEFVNETDNELTFEGIGVLGMANAGPDTNGSQFFITLAPVGRLDGGYTIFGQVTAGMAAVTDVEVRDPSSATEPGTALYRVVIVTIPPEEE